MDIKRWIILLSILIFVFGVFQASNANAQILNKTEINFDTETLLKGFTVKSVNKQLWIPIFAKQYSGDLSVIVNEIDNSNTLPIGKKAVSSFFEYDIQKNYEGFLHQPNILSLAFDDNSSASKQIYFFDNYQKKWRVLPTDKIDSAKNIIQTKTIFPYAKIVVLADAPIEEVKPALVLNTTIPNVIKADFNLTSDSAIVLNKFSNNIVFAKNIDTVHPIASMTKLMTALVFLEHNPGWQEIITMQPEDFIGGATLWVKAGDQISVKDLFNAMLIGSKNNTVMALVRASGLTQKEFVEAMNQKARDLNLNNTSFVEPTGLSEKNVSTAVEMASLAKNAFANLEIFNASTTNFYRVKPINSEYYYTVTNTSEKVLNRDILVTGTKTGWTDEAGYCLVTQAKGNNNELIALVMGADKSQNYEEVYQLLKGYLQ